MPAAVNHRGQFHMSKSKPVASTAADGTFQVVLRVIDRQGPNRAEPWQMVYSGAEAHAWWEAEGKTLQAGDTVQLQATHMRIHNIGKGWGSKGEAQARIESILITGRSGANSREANPSPQPAIA